MVSWAAASWVPSERQVRERGQVEVGDQRRGRGEGPEQDQRPQGQRPRLDRRRRHGSSAPVAAHNAHPAFPSPERSTCRNEVLTTGGQSFVRSGTACMTQITRPGPPLPDNEGTRR